MKYIRTKDCIYEVIKEILDGEAYEVKVPQSKWEYDEDNKCYYEDSKTDGFCKKDIINQSENLEELCDCFVTEGNRHIVWDKQQNKGITFEQVKESFPSYHFKIYGAIWTSKGLIYVAKMDSEGKLELI